MTRFAQTEREARHIGGIRDQLVAALGDGGSRLQLLLRSGAIVVGRLKASRHGGDFPHYHGSLSLLTDTGQTAEVDFLDVQTLDRT